MIAWVDVETTGLDPEKNRLLEVGIVVTDDGANELGRRSVVLAPDYTAHFQIGAVRELHDPNGLWAECKRDGLGRRHGEESMTAWLASMIGEEQPVMGGSSVHFDRAFLREHMPRLHAMFHYRNIDVSTLKEVNRRIGFAPEWDGKRDIHRSIPDLEDTLNEYRHYVRWIGAEPGSRPIRVGGVDDMLREGAPSE